MKLQQFGLRCRKVEGDDCQAEDNAICNRAPRRDWFGFHIYDSLNLGGDEQSSTSTDFHFARLARSLEFRHCLARDRPINAPAETNDAAI